MKLVAFIILWSFYLTIDKYLFGGCLFTTFCRSVKQAARAL